MSRRTPFVAVALLATLAGTAAAQGGGTVVMRQSSAGIPLSDDAITTIVAQHFASALHGTDASQITIVVDANGNYVSGNAKKMTVITHDAMPNGVYVDSSVAGKAVMIRRVASGEAATAATAAPAGVVTFMKSDASGEGAVVHSFMGIDGLAPQDIASTGMKRFAAGTMGDADIMVMVVKLK